MRINHIHEKGMKDINEDSYLIQDNIFGVFDGAGSLNKYVDDEGKTGGFIASTIAQETFIQNNKSLKELAVEANSQIMAKMQERNIDTTDKLNLWCSNLAVVRFEDKQINWTQLSDAAIIFIYKDNSFKVIRGDNDYDQETMIKWKQLADRKKENIRLELDEQLKSVRRKINITYGFLTGEPKMVNFLQEGREDLSNIKHILLFTDGFTIPKTNPTDPDQWDEFVKMYLNGGIEAIKNHIRSIEDSDPNCWTYPRGKQYDDMTAISITL
ncbi:protein phosphatase 2C domain-containing protein [Patescibacteria group bacterium]|nr:protein phosphatase 2C domain-containing protein [Patescibacteria group bacterium]